MVVAEVSPFTGQYVDVNGITMYYLNEGAGKPLVLLHGGTCSSDDTHPLVRSYKEYFRVLAPDTRGHGRSSNPTGKMSYRLMADDVAEFIQALKVEGAIVSGESDGAQVALDLAAHYPGLASALIISGAWFRFTDAYSTGLREALFLEPGKIDIGRLERERTEFVAAVRERHRHVYGDDYWKALLQTYAEMYFTPLDLTAEDFAGITIPTLIMLGDRDEFIPVEEAAAMYRMMPNAELAITPAVGHGADNPSLGLIYMHIRWNFLERHGFLGPPPLEWRMSRGE